MLVLPFYFLSSTFVGYARAQAQSGKCPAIFDNLVIDARQGFEIALSGSLDCSLNLPYNGDNKKWFIRNVEILADKQKVFFIIGGDEDYNSANVIAEIIQNDGYSAATPLGDWNDVVAMGCSCEQGEGSTPTPTFAPTTVPPTGAPTEVTPPRPIATPAPTGTPAPVSPAAPAKPAHKKKEEAASQETADKKKKDEKYLGFITPGWQVGVFWAVVVLVSAGVLVACCMGCFLGLMYLKIHYEVDFIPDQYNDLYTSFI